MSTSTPFLNLLGKASDDANVQAWLNQLGAKSPKLKKGDTDAYVQVTHLGMEIVFTDEAFHTQNDNLAIGEGALIFTAIILYVASNDTHDIYSEPLPFGIQPQYTAKELKDFLGAPEVSNVRLRQDNWTVDGFKMAAKYAKDSHVLRYIFQVS